MIKRFLERVGVIDQQRFDETIDLAWPRIMTGFAIMSKSTVDLAMVGSAVGTAAVAGLAFANAYWNVALFIGIGLAGGTVTLVSQAYGAGAVLRARKIVVQGTIVATIIAVPLITAFVLIPEYLVEVFRPDPEPAGHAREYLIFIAPAIIFEFWNLVASRTYAGIGDTFTPMLIRVTGAVLNIVFSAVLIFEVGLGVIGAAIGTTAATLLVSVGFVWGLGGLPIPGRGICPVAVTRPAVTLDIEIIRDLSRVSAPLVARRAAETIVSFPLLAIASVFGPAIVAAYEVARRVRGFIDSFSWGFSIAASTLVGQRLGADDEADAAEYGWSIIRLSAVVYIIVSMGVILAAEPIARIFVDEAIDTATLFVIVAAISVVFLGVDSSATGTLRGAGDTRYPFWSSVAGRYGGGLTIAAIGLITPLGAAALMIAFVIETLLPAILNLHRVRTDRWKAVSRSYRASIED